MTLDLERQAGALMRRAQAGDRAAYATLLELLASVTRAYARARVGGVPWLDDVVQETLIAVHGARHTYDGNRPFAPWFYAVASSRLIDVVRRQRRVSSREVATDVVPDAAGRTAVPRPEIDVDALHAAVAALPLRQRQVIEGLKFQDLSVREVAGRLQMTESSVKVTAHRGYKALRRMLRGGRT
jgi:RNA polymerase sigma-70 factor (ECF subfamily)